MGITIVPFAATHVEALAALEAACFSDPWSDEALREELGNPCARFLVAESDGRAVGYIGCHHVADEGFVANVAVDPRYRRQGIGRQLVAAAIKQGDGLYRLTLEVRASNEAAAALYRSLGFVKDGTRPRFYAHPTEDADIYSYYFENAR